MVCFDLVDFPNVVLIGRRICSSDWEYAACTIQNHELMFVYQGIGYLTIDGSLYTVKTGDCILLQPGQVFSAKTNPHNPCRYYIVHFKLNGLIEQTTSQAAYSQISQVMQSYNYREMNDIFEMPQIGFKRIFLMQTCDLGIRRNTIFNILEKAIAERNQLILSSETMISNYVCEILTFLSRLTIEHLKIDITFNHGSEIPRTVQEVIFFIHDNYMKKIKLTEICKDIGISPQYLIRIFNSKLQRTPIQYINLFRVSRAKELLKNTTLSIKEITYEIGMENPSYFSRLFKKLENMTPGEYRSKD